MAPLPENNTSRIWVDYTSGGLTHSMLFRVDANFPFNAGIVQTMDNIGAAMLGCMADTDAIVGWRYSNDGTNFSLPWAPGIAGNGTQSGGTINDESRTGFAGVAGRSTGGRKYFCNFFTILTYGLSIYRDDYASLAANFQDFLDAVRNSSGTPGEALVGIDGLDLVFKDYLNFGQHAYWQREQR